MTASGWSIFTITGYSGRDPEINLGGLEPGMDRRTNYYPRTRSFMIGVNMILKHFIRKIQHSNVKLTAQCLTNICQIVKEVRIPAPKMHGYYITFCLLRLLGSP